MTELGNRAADARNAKTRPGGPVWLAVLVFVTGFIAVLTLGLGILVWVAPRAIVNLELGFEPWGHKVTILIHRFGLGAILFGVGAWFALMTRGLWQRRRYGTVLGVMTLGVAL